MKVLVTGAAGFLGSHLVDRLLLDGLDVLGIDNLISGSLANLEHLKSNPKFIFKIGDVRKAITDHVDTVFNFACPASPMCYQKYPIPTLNTSVFGANNLINLSRQCGCKIVHASTSEIYGDPVVHPQREDYWGNVNPVGTRACYDVGKRAAETLFTDAGRTFGTDVRIIRIFNTYGPRMQPNDGRVVSNFIRQALQGTPITLYGSGAQTRSFCYVQDLIDGIIRISELSRLDGPINLGNPEEISIKQLAQHIVRLCQSRSEIVYFELPADDPSRRLPDISKAKELIGFNPQITLEEGLRRSIEYFHIQYES